MIIFAILVRLLVYCHWFDQIWFRFYNVGLIFIEMGFVFCMIINFGVSLVLFGAMAMSKTP